jgi:pimeloyl-ACP methyl ester carboxylesterase
MQKVVTNLLKSLVLCALGVLLVTLRYVLRTPQRLENVLPGEPHLYKWLHGHIHYTVLGEADAPPIVLFHAPEIGASSYQMRAIVAKLAQRYRVYALDLLGFGLSDHPDINYSANTYIALYQDFLVNVVARPATLLASGLSCNYCVALATRAPDLCERLIFLSPLPLFEGESKEHWLIDLVQLPLVGLVLYAFLTTPMILRPLLARRQGLCEGQVAESDFQAVDAAAHQLGAERAALASICGKLALDVSCQLERLQQPTLIVWGAQALVQTHLLPDQLAMPQQTQIVLIQDAGSHVQEIRPEQVVANILDWQAVGSNVPTPAAVETVEAYCVKCRIKRPMHDPKEVVTKNGRRALEGTCPICGVRLFRFIAA